MNTTITEIFDALETNNENTGGAYIDVSVPGWAIKEWGIVAQDAQGLTVAGYGFTPQAGTFNIVSIPARGVASVHELPLANDTHVTGLRVGPELFAWTDYVSPSPYDPRSDPRISVASLPRVQIANVEITPTVALTIETGSRPNDEFYTLGR